MRSLVALLMLCVGVLLEVGGLSFVGLDLLVGACFLGALIAGATTTLSAASPYGGLLTVGLASVALVLHLWLNFS